MDALLEQTLHDLKITYVFHTHPAVFTVAESKHIKESIPGVQTKSLFLKDELGKFYLMCLRGSKRLNIKFLQQFLNIRKLVFGSAEELLRELHITPGSVSIFCLIYGANVTLILDKELWDAERVCFHPNVNTETLELAHTEFAKFYDSLNLQKFIVELPES
jgi:Ala-tRNA(Pro) deacylase